MKTPMLLICVAFALLSMGAKGCESPPPPPEPKPEIVVESIESTNNTGATLYFENHNYNQNAQQNRRVWIRLANPQEIKDYKAQLEFTLRRLEDIERRMTVHEDSQQSSAAVPENAASTGYPLPDTP